jgi:hypothetical protein
MEPAGSLLCSQKPPLNQMDPIHIAISPQEPPLNQMDPIRIAITCFSKIHVNTCIKHPPPPASRLGFPSGLFRSRLTEISYWHLLASPIRATCSSHLTLLDLMTIIKFGKGCKLWNSSSWNFLHVSVTSSIVGPIILFSALFPNTLNPGSASNVRERVSLPPIQKETHGELRCLTY